VALEGFGLFTVLESIVFLTTRLFPFQELFRLNCYRLLFNEVFIKSIRIFYYRFFFAFIESDNPKRHTRNPCTPAMAAPESPHTDERPEKKSAKSERN
jgi:hypothetical protein